MTNDHPDSDAVHEEGADHENASHEAGTWTDDRPPHDDFTDAAASEEMASASQESTAESDETAAAVAARSRSRLPVVIGILCVLVLGGVGYWKFGQLSTGSSVTAQTDMPKPAAASESTGSTPKVAAIQPSDLSAAGKENDINALKVPANTSASASGAGSSNSPPPIPMVPVVPPAANNSPTAAVIAVPPVEQGKAIPVLPPSSEAVQNTMPAPAPLPMVPATTVAGPGQSQARMDALASRIDNLEKSLDEAAKQMAQMSDHMAAVQAVPTPNQANPALEARLDKIEQNLQHLQHSAPAKSVATAPKTVAANTAPAAKKTSAAMVPSIKHKPPHKKIAASHTRAKPQPAQEAAAPVSSAWILRAATPTEAWISVSATSPELHHVQLGDQLPGIGSVQAIHQTPSGWEVIGSEGIVR